MPWKTAEHSYSELDNGLMQPWFGRVWLNPPYDRDIGVWLDRMVAHGNGMVLIFARTDTKAFQRNVLERADALFFFEGRLSFCKPDGSTNGASRSGAPSVLVAYGRENVVKLSEFADKGSFPGFFLPL